MRLHRYAFVVASLSTAWIGCNLVLGVERAEFVPGVDDADEGDRATTRDGNVEGSIDPDADPCVNVVSNPSHCGRCNHSCLGGVCAGGICQPFVLAAVAGGGSTIAVDATHAYWINGDQGDLWRVPLAGGPVQLVFDGPEFGNADRIVFDGNDVLIGVSIPDGGVLRCPKAGCGAAPVFELPFLDFPGSLARGGNVLYVAQSQNTGRILACTMPCTSFTVVAPSESFPANLTYADGGLFWSRLAPTALRSIEGAGTPQTIATGQPIGDITATADEVFWAENDGPRAAQRDGGSPRALRTIRTLTNDIALDDANVYFTEYTKGNVIACSRDAGCGDAGTRLAFDQADPRGITVDDKAIYWVNGGTEDAGQVMRLAK